MTATLEQARAALIAASAVLPHTGADGSAAGAIALRARGECADAAVGAVGDLGPAAFHLAKFADRVNFSARGHAAATGGSLALEDFERLLQGLGS